MCQGCLLPMTIKELVFPWLDIWHHILKYEIDIVNCNAGVSKLFDLSTSLKNIVPPSTFRQKIINNLQQYICIPYVLLTSEGWHWPLWGPLVHWVLLDPYMRHGFYLNSEISMANFFFLFCKLWKNLFF